MRKIYIRKRTSIFLKIVEKTILKQNEFFIVKFDSSYNVPTVL